MSPADREKYKQRKERIEKTRMAKKLGKRMG